MIKLTTIILLMAVGSLVYQAALAKTPDYVEPIRVIYWASVTAFVFWLAGLLKI